MKGGKATFAREYYTITRMCTVGKDEVVFT